MPVLTQTNLYRGVNAHLHSHWQMSGGWHNFHNRHIGDLAGLLRLQLLPMGYTATLESSLQIRRVGDDVFTPRADVLISDLSTPPAPGVTPTVAQMLTAEQDTGAPYRAVVIRDKADRTPVAWLELLSPSNKGAGPDAQAYLLKRRDLLASGLVFIEIDYLHETPPTFPRLLDYTDPLQRNAGAYPYRIVVLDPRPDITSGPAHPAEFAVDDPIPTVSIPLNAEQSLAFDFGAAYDKTYTEMGYGLESVDYAELPPNFDGYNVRDQWRVLKKMVVILRAHVAGETLTAAPTPNEDVNIDDLKAQWQSLLMQI